MYLIFLIFPLVKDFTITYYVLVTNPQFFLIGAFIWVSFVSDLLVSLHHGDKSAPMSGLDSGLDSISVSQTDRNEELIVWDSEDFSR